MTDPAFCGVSRAHLGDVIEELADLWLARRESELRERRGAERQREAGAGPKHDLVFTDRLLDTLVHLRIGDGVRRGLHCRGAPWAWARSRSGRSSAGP
ncbi:hypothetical protein ACWGDS_41790 [Streptomyces sp. NPDC055059]|uniref:Uncharacterized protein n=1 Tax=Streptomyces sp. NBC_00119 TaxID=2975659 RepID=A0AAU1TZJ9_9ACTN|nr:hypothetical protein [Streptomyces sp. NBC_00120]MCX5323659.1 hypothetical protein [Streptomyces sp. NBC_00120]